MVTRIQYVIIFFLSSISISAGAQEVGSWWMYFGSNRVSDRWSIWTEAQYRNHDFGIDIEQLLLRTALNFHLTKNAQFSFGYGYVGSYVSETDINNPSLEEGRIYEQYLHKHRMPFLGFEHRIRLEQRWAAGFYKNRFRYRLFLTIPLNKKYIEEDTWFLGIYDEIFLNTTGETFDRNRFYGALGYQINEFINVQSGMMHQQTQNSQKWYFQLALILNTDFRK